MLLGFQTNRRSRAVGKRRDGLSVLEVTGCLVAVIGGMCIGAHCLGVTWEHLAYNTLDRTKLLDKLPSDWRPQNPHQTESSEQHASKLSRELGLLREEIGALRSGSSVPTTASAAPAQEITSHNGTRTYWLRLSEIALNEANMQREAEKSIDDANAAKVFTIKSRVSRFAAKGIEAIPSAGVDESLVKFGRQLSAWYDHAAELYDQASRIWETTARQPRSSYVDQWKQSDLQLRHEARLLRERAAALRSSISRQLGEEFPEFATQNPPAKPLISTKKTAGTS